ncbi:MAG: sister chromatid cohesion protein PDS5 [Gemmataceae bacterium]|nr:sister chromatid cohesion protein PDS5 [Gemmataceae bacterium]MDW8266749.1 HEAT repeat domain-containing protein [Gemmataceae bacterium]
MCGRSFILLAIGLGLVFGGRGFGQSRKVAELLQDLKDKNPRVRQAAAEDAGRLARVRIQDARQVQPALRAALKDTDANVRAAALQAFASFELEPKAYLAMLVDALKTDKAPVVRQAAINGLTQLGNEAKSALPNLHEVYKSALAAQKANEPAEQASFRRLLVDTVVRLDSDPQKVVPFLVLALKGERNLPNRVAVVQALRQIGPPAKDAVPALLEAQKAAKALKGKDMGLLQEIEMALKQIQK